MMQKILITIFLTICLAPVFGQTDKKAEEEAIKKTINQFFEGMQKGDTSIMMKSIADTMGLQSVTINRKGETRLRYETVNDIVISITKKPANITSIEERISFDAIHIDGNLASVWTPYKFYINNNLSHCGANSFTLAKFKSGWRIVNIIDTRRREGCE
jgi:Putative lumazine-binding